ncbi:MAG: PqqD family protein [Candidatus Omnitrophica bacterium]|nr:PqqD family protein [Candidatus Omnitrophota bacterium]MDD5610506.1 PqqD family protein [Candidatus Omnitrophota bacterium]
MDLLNSFIKRNDDIAWRIIDEEALVVDSKDSLIYPLNTVGSRIWELLDGKRPCSEIVDTISEEFEGEKESIKDDVLNFLEHLLEKGLAKECA